MDWITTYTGKRFYPQSPRCEDVDVRDVAHSLALKTRFGGHGQTFYSVAQHSVHVSELLSAELAAWGLMHDAAEAYLADVPRPVKRCLVGFAEMEDAVLRAVAERFALAWPVPGEVWRADDVMLATEARDLIAGGGEGWGLMAEPADMHVVPLTWEEAEAQFIGRWKVLLG